MNSNDIRPGSFQAWAAFTRPKTWGVAVAPVIASLSLALTETDHLSPIIAFFTLTIALLMQIVSNMKNDLGYTERKAETGNRKGLPRATSMGWISITAARRGILAAIALSLINTAILIYFGGWYFALIGIASVTAAYAYMGGPYPIAYTPLGELTVLVFFGLTAVCGTYYLQTGLLSVNAVLLGIALGSIAAGVLCINNWRDRVHDRSIGRRTLAVVLNDNPFTTLFRILMFLPFMLVIIMIGLVPKLWPSLIVFLCFPDCISIPRDMKRLQHEALNQTMFACVKLELKYSVLFAIGSVVSWLLL